MNEERKMILQMLKDGEISVDEAERLIDAVSDEPKEPGAEKSGAGLSPKRIFILIKDGDKAKVNVKIPFSLMRTAIKLGKTAGLIGAMNTKNKQDGVSDEILATIKAIDPDEILSSLSEGAISLPHTIVDMDDIESGQNIKIIIE